MVEFFWDSRPPKKRTFEHGPSTGHLAFPAAPTGECKPYKWVPDRPAPAGLKLAYQRREGGYVFEWSIPIEQLGYASPDVSGRQVHLELQVIDQDAEPGFTWMTAGGLRQSNHFTTYYLYFVFE